MAKLLSSQPEKPAKSGGGGFKIVLLVVVLSAGGYFGWDYWKKQQAGEEAATPGGAAKTNATAAATLTTNNNPIARAKETLTKWVDRTSDQETKAAPAPAAAKPATSVAAGPRPTGQPASAIPGMPKVQAIFYAPKDATAIIAGKTVKNGDQVEGAKVLEIKRQSVRMQLGVEAYEVTIK